MESENVKYLEMNLTNTGQTYMLKLYSNAHRKDK